MRVGVVSEAGECILGPERRPAGRERPAEEIAADVASALRSMRGRLSPDAEVTGVAVGAPAAIGRDGAVGVGCNLPTMAGFRLGAWLEQKLRLPAAVFNDAACFAMGEWRSGAGKGTRSFAGMTLGTGLGLGIVLDGQLYSGAHGCAGEIWRSPFENGILEDKLSGRAIEETYCKLSGNSASGPQILERARHGETAALRAYAEFGEALGKALCWLVNMFDPEVVALGGSIAEAFDFFKEPAARAMAEQAVAGKFVRLERSVLGEKAALVGAAGLFAQNRKTHP